MTEQAISPYENVTFSIGFAARHVRRARRLVLRGRVPGGHAGAQHHRRACSRSSGRPCCGRPSSPTARAGSSSSPSTQPPKGISPLFASVVLNKTTKGAAAQLVDFAVNRRMRIIENPDTGFFSSKSYTLAAAGCAWPGGPGAQPRAGRVRLLARSPARRYTIQKQDTTLSQQVRAVHRRIEGRRRRSTASSRPGSAGQVWLPDPAGDARRRRRRRVRRDPARQRLRRHAAALLLCSRASWSRSSCSALTARKPLTEQGCGAAGSPRGAAGVHQARRGRPPEGAAEPAGRRAEPGLGRRPARGAEAQREAAALRGAVRPREGVGGGAQQVLRRGVAGLVLGLGRVQRRDLRVEHRLDLGERRELDVRQLRARAVVRAAAVRPAAAVAAAVAVASSEARPAAPSRRWTSPGSRSRPRSGTGSARSAARPSCAVRRRAARGRRRS